MGTVGALRDARGRFTGGRPSPYQGRRPGADVGSTVGLSMQTALAAQPASRKYATGFPTNFNINYARMLNYDLASRFKTANGNTMRDVYHKGFLVFLVNDWQKLCGDSHHDTDSSTTVDIISLAGLNSVLARHASKRSDIQNWLDDVAQAVSFDGVVRNQVGAQVEDVFMRSTEHGVASVLNNTVRGRVPVQNVWSEELKGNQMLFLLIRYTQLPTNGYRTDPNDGAKKHDTQQAGTLGVQVEPWIGEGDSTPPCEVLFHKGSNTHGYYIRVGRCSDRKRFSKCTNQSSSKRAYYDARSATVAPCIEMHVETASPPFSYKTLNVPIHRPRSGHVVATTWPRSGQYTSIGDGYSTLTARAKGGGGVYTNNPRGISFERKDESSDKSSDDSDDDY